MIDEHAIVRRQAERLSPPEPAFERLLRRRQRRRRNQRLAAGAIGIAVFAGAVAVPLLSGGDRDGSPGPLDTGTPTPTLTAEPPVETERIGFIGLPPAGAAPSAPEGSELVLEFYGGTQDGPRTIMYVYADGRLVWRQEAGLPFGANNKHTGWLERRLSPEGVELMRHELLSTGLFDRDRELTLPGIDPCLNYMGVHNGERFATITYSHGCSDGTDGGPAPIATQDEAWALFQLDALLNDPLEDPPGWLPETAWEDPRIRPYVPSRFAVCFVPIPGGDGLDRETATGALPETARTLLADAEWSTAGGILERRPEPHMFPFPCAVISTDRARAVADSLRDAGLGQDPSMQPWVLGFDTPAPAPVGDVTIMFEPVFPHGGWACSACG